VKSVALAAPASDFTVTGSPVPGTGTLSLVWTHVPTSANTKNAIVKRDGSGNFSAGTITATSATLSSSLSINSDFGGPLSVASSASNATAIYGQASAATGAVWGVEGLTESSDSSAHGVTGFATSGTGNPVGVYGQAASPSAIGVFGQSGSESSIGAGGPGTTGAGIWGDAGLGTVTAYGVVGTADDAISGLFINNSITSPSIWIVNYNPYGLLFDAFDAGTGDGCHIDADSNVICDGAVNPVVAIDGGARKVALSAIESPKNWFEDFGSAQLADGSAVVVLDPDFMQTINTGKGYHVFLTPNGGLSRTLRRRENDDVIRGKGTGRRDFEYRLRLSHRGAAEELRERSLPGPHQRPRSEKDDRADEERKTEVASV
jgi:hypothetical protein